MLRLNELIKVEKLMIGDEFSLNNNYFMEQQIGRMINLFDFCQPITAAADT